MDAKDAKVGMTVRVVKSPGAAKIGATAKVISIKSLSGLAVLDVEWVRNDLHNGQHDGEYYPHTFEPVVPQVFIVVDSLDEVTAKHSSLEAAENDARAAATDLNETFTVFQRIAAFKPKFEVSVERG